MEVTNMKNLIMMVAMFISGFLMVKFGWRIVEDCYYFIIANDITMMSKGFMLNEVGKFSSMYIPFYRIGKELIVFVIGMSIGIFAFPTEKEVK